MKNTIIKITSNEFWKSTLIKLKTMITHTQLDYILIGTKCKYVNESKMYKNLDKMWRDIGVEGMIFIGILTQRTCFEI